MLCIFRENNVHLIIYRSGVQKMNVRQKYRGFVCVLLGFGIIGLGVCSLAAVRAQIPSQMQVADAGELPELFHNAFDRLITKEISAREPAALEEKQGGTTLVEVGESLNENAVPETYKIMYRLFGKIPLKMVTVSVVPRKQVYVGGTPIGIYLKTDGVMVVETGEIQSADGDVCCPAENIVKSGDYIKAVNGVETDTKERLVECISACGGEDVVLAVDRAGEQISLKVHPVQDESGTYKAGIWVRSDTQGIGTLTYVDKNGKFGALGHGISDIDTGKLLDISGGILYNADVISIIKGSQGVPGELAGVIHYSEGYRIGEIEENRKDGIYGETVGFPAMSETMKLCETAYKQEVVQGPATILCSVDGACKEYDVDIREIRLNGSDVNKGMVIEVTDPRLLELTGGIVQGMSGSPILQNGRIVGAVTHVFVQDAKKGYGIFVESMLGH